MNTYVYMYRDNGVCTFECICMCVLGYMYEFVQLYKYLHVLTCVYVLYVPLSMHGCALEIFHVN